MGTDGNVIRNQNKRRIMIFSIFTLIFLGFLGTQGIVCDADEIFRYLSRFEDKLAGTQMSLFDF